MQYKFLLRSLILVFFVLILTQCREDEINVTELESTTISPNENVSFLINIVDEMHKSIEDLKITFDDDSNSYTLNENGILIINDVTVSDIGSKLVIEKEGYFTQIKMLSGVDNSTNIEEVILVKKDEGVILNTGDVGTIDGGGILELPMTLLAESGTAYSGAVRVLSHYFDPDNSEYIQQAPGNMLGIDKDEELRVLGSLGMYAIELYHPETGEELQIPEGNTAQLSFPVADIQKDIISDEVPLWSFDEEEGIWYHEGIARLDGDMLIAEVSHFSFWNCDLPYRFIPFCITFTGKGEAPLPGINVNFLVNNQGFGYDVTNDEGIICGKLPEGQRIHVSINNFGELLDEVEIGPFTEGQEDITIELSIFNCVEGVAIDCDDLGISNGYGIITHGDVSFLVIVQENGSFSYSIFEDHSLLLINRDTDEFRSVEILESSSDVNLGVVEVCNDEPKSIISGVVMLDQDEDGTSDLPVEGVEVKLINLLTGSEDKTAMTNTNGEYTIDVIPNVQYKLAVDVPADMKLIALGDTSPEGNSQTELWNYKTRNGGIFVLFNDSGEIDDNNDFQLVENGTGTVSGVVLKDIDGDSIGDVPHSDLELTLVSYTQGTEENTQLMTDVNGEYSVELSNFIGEIIIGINTVFDSDTSPDPDGDDESLGANSVIPIRLQIGENDEDNTFYTGGGTISGFVLEDSDNDNVGDVPIAGIEIMLEDINGQIVNSTTTDFNGIYIFENLLPGSYFVNEQNEAEIDKDFVDVYDGDDSDDGDPTDGILDQDDIIPVTIIAGENDSDNNFVEEQLGSISGSVMIDTNEDEVGDLPFSEQSITLTMNSTGQSYSIETDENGSFVFDELESGDYILNYNVSGEFEIIYDGDDTPEDANDAIDSLGDGEIGVFVFPGEDDEDNNFVIKEI